ncbi:hypothetical protein V1517DRAFT_331955 [Lipomyces orientalis]|uniref:Uncharacterized protein n=1 Tax=Lipomyces orientalis TaxID=1233043 RepID=A0ACC3TEM3_9ASCO
MDMLRLLKALLLLQLLLEMSVTRKLGFVLFDLSHETGILRAILVFLKLLERSNGAINCHFSFSGSGSKAWHVDVSPRRLLANRP